MYNITAPSLRVLAVLLPEDVGRPPKHVGEWPVIRGGSRFCGT